MDRKILVAAAIGMTIAASGARASIAPPALPSTVVYRNEQSGIEFEPLPGLSRKITMFGGSGLDVGIDYRSETAGEDLTFFLFRRVTGDAALWLDRVTKVVKGREQFAQLYTAIPTFTFPRPGSSTADGLGVVFGATAKNVKSTGAAIFASGDWYVAIRATSNTRDPEELRAWIATVSASIRWPKSQQPLPAPAPIVNCEKSIGGSDKAEFHIPPLAAILAEAAMAHDVKGNRAKEIAPDFTSGPWCVDRDLVPMLSVYRRPHDHDSYLLALADSGRAYRVAKSSLMPILDPGRAQDYFVTWVDLDHVEGYGATDQLPSPEWVESFVKNREYAFSATTWGEGSNIQINSNVVSVK